MGYENTTSLESNVSSLKFEAWVCCLFVILMLAVFVSLISGDWIWGALSVVFLLITLSHFFLRSHFLISTAGIRAEFPLRTRQLSWEAIQWVRYDDLSALVRCRRRSLLRSREFTMLFGAEGPAVIGAIERMAPDGLATRSSSGRGDS